MAKFKHKLDLLKIFVHLSDIDLEFLEIEIEDNILYCSTAGNSLPEFSFDFNDNDGEFSVRDKKDLFDNPSMSLLTSLWLKGEIECDGIHFAYFGLCDNYRLQNRVHDKLLENFDSAYRFNILKRVRMIREYDRECQLSIGGDTIDLMTDPRQLVEKDADELYKDFALVLIEEANR